MRVLTIFSSMFRLPDDFNGSFADALRLMADYHDARLGKTIKSGKIRKALRDGQIRVSDQDKPIGKVQGEMFDDFIELVQNGKRFSGVIEVKDFDPKVKVEALK